MRNKSQTIKLEPLSKSIKEQNLSQISIDTSFLKNLKVTVKFEYPKDDPNSEKIADLIHNNDEARVLFTKCMTTSFMIINGIEKKTSSSGYVLNVLEELVNTYLFLLKEERTEKNDKS